MSLSFSLKTRTPDTRPRRKVLITGAGGSIGTWLTENLHSTYDLRLLAHSPEEVKRLEAFGEVVEADISQLEQMKSVCEGIDTVVHLAADPSPSAVWQSLLPNNIIGTYNVMVAARSANCRRFIYASSIHAVGGYPTGVQVKTSDPVNPGDLYGVSKCFGEALGRYMAEQEGLEVIVLRIGAFTAEEKALEENTIPMMDGFVSRRDLTDLFVRCIDDETLRFAIFNGVSDNSFQRLDISDAKELVGYAPQDNFFRINPTLAQLELDERRSSHNQGDAGQESGIREELRAIEDV